MVCSRKKSLQKDNKPGARTPDALFSSGFSQVTPLVKQFIQNKPKIINWEKMDKKTITSVNSSTYTA